MFHSPIDRTHSGLDYEGIKSTLNPYPEPPMRIRQFSLILLASFVSATIAQADVLYSVQELGAFAPVGINNRGEVVGNDLPGLTGYYWSEGTGVVTIPYSLPSGINNQGVVTGSRLLFADAFRWTPDGDMTTLTLPYGLSGTSTANGINDLGQVVGDVALSSVSGAVRRGHIWNENGSVQFLTDDAFFQAWGINNSSTVVGTIITSTTEQAAVWNASTGLIPLTDPTSRPSSLSLPSNYAYFVSDDGLVGGVIDDLPFFWTEAQGLVYPDVPTGMQVGGFNSLGHIVGQLGSAAYLWSEELGPINLNEVLDESGAGWELMLALRSNDVGQIVGIGINPFGENRAFRLTPVAVPEASTLVLAGFGIAVAVAWRRKRHLSRDE
jgi:hypothetical protein